MRGLKISNYRNSTKVTGIKHKFRQTVIFCMSHSPFELKSQIVYTIGKWNCYCSFDKMYDIKVVNMKWKKKNCKTLWVPSNAE